MKSDPKQIKRALVLRESGYSLSAIAERTRLSPSTLQRHFKRLGATCGGLTSESVEQAKQSLLQDAGFIDELRHTIAATIIDDLSIVRKIRESLILSLEELTEDATTPASMKARSLAALSTSLSVTQAVARRALNIDSETQRQHEDLPTLTIRKMDSAEIAAVQNRLKDGDEENQSLVTEY
jgi:hypothetical protein